MNSHNDIDVEKTPVAKVKSTGEPSEEMFNDLKHKTKLANALPITLIIIFLSIAGILFENKLESSYSNTITISLMPDNEESNEKEVEEPVEVNDNTRLAGSSLYEAFRNDQVEIDSVDQFELFKGLSASEILVAKSIAVKKLRDKKYYERSLELIVSLTQQQQQALQLIFSKAFLLAKLGHHSAAIISYEHLLSLQPNHQAANINLGLLYLQHGFTVKAEQVFIRGIVNTAGNKKAKNYTGLGDALFHQQKFQDAILNYRKAIEYRPAYALTWRKLAKAARKQADHPLVLDSYQKSILLDKNSAKTRVEFAGYLNSRLEFSSAIEQLKQAKRIDQESFSIRLKLAFAYIQAKKPINAKKQLNLAKKSIQQPFDKRRSEALQKYLSEKYPDAINLIKNNLSDNPDSDFDLYLLAKFYLAADKAKLANQFIEKIGKGSDYYYQANYLIADYWFKSGQTDRSITQFRQITSIINDNPMVLNQASKAEQQAENYPEAIELLNKALEAGRSRRLLLRRADLYWLQGAQDIAINQLNELVQEYPSYLRAIYHLASYNLQMNDSAKAIEGFESLLAQRATYGDAQYQLAVIYFEQSDFARSQDLLAGYLQKKPDSKRTRLLYARSFCETGQSQSCKEQLELVLRLAPDYLPALDLQQSIQNN